MLSLEYQSFCSICKPSGPIMYAEDHAGNSYSYSFTCAYTCSTCIKRILNQNTEKAQKRLYIEQSTLFRSSHTICFENIFI